MHDAGDQNISIGLLAACDALDNLRQALDRATEQGDEAAIADLKRAIAALALTIDEITGD